MYPSESDARASLDRAHAEFEQAEANCAAIELSLNAAYDRQTAAEAEYNRLKAERKAGVRSVVRAFVGGDDHEPPFESSPEFEGADAELDRYIDLTLTFENDHHKANLAKIAAADAVEKACYAVIQARLGAVAARAKELAAELAGILPFLSAAVGTLYAAPDIELNALLERHKFQVPDFAARNFKTCLWLWCDALKTDSTAEPEF